MKNSNLPNQFVNSFVRQLGREAAHDAYRSSGNGNGEYYEVIGSEGCRVWNPMLSQAFSTLVWIPFSTIFYFVKAIAMIFAKKPVYQEILKVRWWKPDRRCKCGSRYLGDGTMGGGTYKTENVNAQDLKAYQNGGWTLILTVAMIAGIKLIALGVILFMQN